MPLLGLLASRLFGLPPALAAGVVLVACCPGGTASNIVSYMARADVPLSVLMTSVSTVGAVVMTPLLTKLLLAGTAVPVDGAAMLASTAQVVLVPVLLGSALNSRFPRTVARVSTFTPAGAVLMVALVCAATVSRSVTSLGGVGAGGAVGAAGLKAAAPGLLGALLLLHTGGFFLGYVLSRGAGLRERVCRTNSIEVGMQNSTLGAALATLHFADPAVAAPAAISACMHSCLGSLLAAFWRRRDRSRGD
jgi:BASS family bile acid:Na+ symporter